MPWNHGSDRSPIVKTTDTHKPYFCPRCMKISSQLRRSGMIFEPSKAGCYHHSISSTEVFPARTSVLLDVRQAWKESEADYFSRSLDSSKKSNQLSFSLKMSQPLGPVEQNEWGKNWPAVGMIVDGMLYPLKKWAHVTSENVGSYSVPTPTACDYGKNNGRNTKNPALARDRWSLTVMARRGALPNHPEGSLNPAWIEQAMGYPIEWTAIADWATAWFRSKRKQPSRD